MTHYVEIEILKNIDINKIIREQLNEEKRTINNEIKALIKERKKSTKYNQNIQSSILYEQGKVTTTKKILGSLSTFDFMSKIL